MVILVVDDSPDIIALLEAMIVRIAGGNCEVFSANNGVDALSLMNRMVVTPDLIISNIRMPGMDGISFIRNVRGNHLWGSLPIVMMSALFSDAIRDDALSCGVAGFLNKPFSFQDVESLLCSFAFH